MHPFRDPIVVCFLLFAAGCGSAGMDGMQPPLGLGVAGGRIAAVGGNPEGSGGVIARGAGAGSGSGSEAVAGRGVVSVMDVAGGAAGAGAAGVGMNGGAGAAGIGMNGGAGAAGAGAAADGGMVKLTVFIAGDSTVSTYEDTASDHDQAGWGQMLHEQVKTGVTIDNRAIGGRTARRFIDDGKLDEIWRDIHPGDYLLVQFGTNDSNKTATYTHDGQTIPYYLEPETDFKTWLKRYIDGARSKQASVVLVTPPPRSSAYCTGGNGTGAWAQAMRELGQSEMLIVSDLNQRSVDYLKAICPAPDPPDFFLQKPDGSIDGTHFQERGARKLAELVADGLRAAGVSWVRAR